MDPIYTDPYSSLIYDKTLIKCLVIIEPFLTERALLVNKLVIIAENIIIRWIFIKKFIFYK